MKIRTKNLGLFLNLAQLHEMTGETELATKYLDKALEIEPKIKF